MIAGLIIRVREHLAEPLNRTAMAVIVSTLMTSALGFGFWLVAALIFEPQTVGRDNALVSAMMLIATVCLLNLNNVLMRFLPQISEHVGRRVVQAYAISAGCSFVVALVFALTAGSFSDDLEFLGDDPLWVVGFALICALWSIWVMQDAALVALGKAAWMVPENATFSVLKIAALPVFFWIGDDHGVFMAYFVPALVVLPVINWMIFKRAVPRAAAAQTGAGGVVSVFGWRRLFIFSAQDFIGSAVGEIVVVAMPLLVISLLTATETAYFSVPFMLIAALDMMYYAVTVALTTEAARDPRRVGQLTDLAVRRLTHFQLPVSLAIAVAAPLILLPFPAEYAENGTTVLRLLALTSAMRAVVLFYEASARLQGHGARLMAAQVANTAGVLGFALLWAPEHGIDGIAVGWLITHGVIAAVVLPGLLRFIRRPAVLARDLAEPLTDPARP
ncbi:MAG: hypothetical protein WAP37_07450 [Solirubrobacterales bacterium]